MMMDSAHAPPTGGQQFKHKKARSSSKTKVRQQSCSVKRLTAGVPSASRAELAAIMKPPQGNVSPIMNTQYTHNSTQDLSVSNHSQMHHSRKNLAANGVNLYVNEHSLQEQSQQRCAGKQRVASRSRPSRPSQAQPKTSSSSVALRSRSKSTHGNNSGSIISQSHSNFVPIRQAYASCAVKGSAAHSAKKTSSLSKHEIDESSRNTFKMAQSQNQPALQQHQMDDRVTTAEVLPPVWPGDKMFACANTHSNSREAFKSTPMIKPVSSDQHSFYQQVKSPQNDEQIAQLERELKSVLVENRSLKNQLETQKNNMTQMRSVFFNSQPAMMLNELTDEVQKAHDLEHLIRRKERSIEILRGDLDDAREAKKLAEEDFQKIEAQNLSLLRENQQLQDSNAQLWKALQLAMQTCEHLKSQRNDYSERFGYLSHEMESLRDLAKEVKSNKGMTSNASNLENQTAHKSSIDLQHSKARHKQYSSYSQQLPTAKSDQVNTNKANQTLGIASPHGFNKKLEPILEEKYFIKQPETTKHESLTARGGLPTSESHEGIFVQEVGGMTLQNQDEDKAHMKSDETLQAVQKAHQHQQRASQESNQLANFAAQNEDRWKQKGVSHPLNGSISVTDLVTDQQRAQLIYDFT